MPTEPCNQSRPFFTITSTSASSATVTLSWDWTASTSGVLTTKLSPTMSGDIWLDASSNISDEFYTVPYYWSLPVKEKAKKVVKEKIQENNLEKVTSYISKEIAKKLYEGDQEGLYLLNNLKQQIGLKKIASKEDVEDYCQLEMKKALCFGNREKVDMMDVLSRKIKNGDFS